MLNLTKLSSMRNNYSEEMPLIYVHLKWKCILKQFLAMYTSTN